MMRRRFWNGMSTKTRGVQSEAGRKGVAQAKRIVRYTFAAAMYITISQRFPNQPRRLDSNMSAVGRETALSVAQQSNGARPTAGVNL
jgi:hypothetical protein